MAKKQKKETIGWAGFMDDKLDRGWIEQDNFLDGLFGIFKTKKEAKEKYEDVRKVKITFLE